MRLNDSQPAELPYADWEACLKQAETKPLPEVLTSLGGLEFRNVQQGIFEHCRETQATILLEILNRCKDTKFGISHGFAEFKTVEDYRAKMPMTSWEDYEPYSQRLEAGEADLLFPGSATAFYITSGTSSKAKLIPECKYGEAARQLISRARRAQLDQIIGNAVGNVDMSRVRILSMSNVTVAYNTSAGIPCGSASGMTNDALPPELKALAAYPQVIKDIYTGDDLNYMLLRCALPRDDIRVVTGNNPARFALLGDYAVHNAQSLIDDIKTGGCALPIPSDIREKLAPYLTANPERAKYLTELLDKGQMLPKYYWPEIRLACFWLGGSIGVFIDEVKRILPDDTIYMDIGYGSSEVKINIPFEHGSPVGTLAVHCGFFEFIPETGGEPLMAHELEDGKRYEIVVTTYSGLYRYKLHDLIQVDGFKGNTPNIYFVTKLGDVGSIAQEKLPGSVLAQCVYEVARKKGLEPIAIQAYTDLVGKHYALYMELSDYASRNVLNDALINTLEKEIDKRLCDNIEMYRYVREAILKPITVSLMKAGWKERLFEKHKKGASSISQVKLPVIISEPPESEWVIK